MKLFGPDAQVRIEAKNFSLKGRNYDGLEYIT